MRKFYHATHSSNISRILSEGLTLPIGRVTSGSRTHPRIYLYKDVADAEEHVPALYYLGAMPRTTPYATFRVNLPSSFKTYGDIEYRGSVFVTRTIPPKYIELISTHSEDYTEFKGVDWDKPRKVKSLKEEEALAEMSPLERAAAEGDKEAKALLEKEEKEYWESPEGLAEAAKLDAQFAKDYPELVERGKK